MQTQKLNNNKTMRTGFILAAIAIITLIALIMTFAKYASQGTGEDSVRVAKWGLNVNENLDLKLFSSSYKDPLEQSVTVDASDDASVVAPGTSKQAEVQLGTYSGQPPEVMYHFEPTLTITNLGDTGQDLITKLNENKGFTWTLKVNDSATTSYNTTDEICSAVSGLAQKDIAANTYPTNFGPIDNPKITIGWAWDFTDGGDQSDTELGNLVANGDLKAMKVELGIKAYQCQGCSGSKQDPKFTPDANMPAEGSSLSMVTEDELATSASVESGAGKGTATSSNTAVAIATATPSNDGKTISYKVSAVGGGSATITLGITENDIYKASARTFNVNVSKTSVDIPTAIENLTYNGNQQTGVTYDSTLQSYDVTDDSVLSATDAGSYSATFYLRDTNKCEWADGTTENKTVHWTIAKAENEMVYNIPSDASTASTAQSTDVKIAFPGSVTGEGSDQNLAYGVTKLNTSNGDNEQDDSNDEFSVEKDGSNWYLVCKANTVAGTYNLKTWAKSGGDGTNYTEKVDPSEESTTKNFTWIVKTTNTIRQVSGVNCGGRQTNFLPVFNSLTFLKEKGVEFYTDAAGSTPCTTINNLIQSGCNMSDFGNAYNSAASSNTLYAIAPSSVKFFGTVNYDWDTTFSDNATLSTTFIRNFNIGQNGRDTVYCNGGSWDNATGTPTLNSGDSDVSYDSFYNTYSGLISSLAYFAWTSRASSDSQAYLWRSNQGWSFSDKTINSAVVLSQAF